MYDKKTPSKIDLRYTDSRVVFSICDCSLDKNYSFYKLNRGKATKLIKKLQYIEKMTWRKLIGLSRKKGLTSEKPNSASFNIIDAQNSSEQKIAGEKYYFHLRIEQSGLFRVFGYQKEQLFCITHIDPNGKIHH